MPTKKKKKGRRVNVSMGDTVRLSKGRIGLIRFIGRTQFGLGEWIGIELYNTLIRTRHNGAVLGKRYFRCPPHRGVFIRRALIQENIAVLDIQPSINKLREKEKKMTSKKKKENQKKRETKKLKNEQKRAVKRLKIEAKYGTPIDKLPAKKKTKKGSRTPTVRSTSPNIVHRNPRKLVSQSPRESATKRSKSPHIDRVAHMTPRRRRRKKKSTSATVSPLSKAVKFEYKTTKIDRESGTDTHEGSENPNSNEKPEKKIQFQTERMVNENKMKIKNRKKKKKAQSEDMSKHLYQKSEELGDGDDDGDDEEDDDDSLTVRQLEKSMTLPELHPHSKADAEAKSKDSSPEIDGDRSKPKTKVSVGVKDEDGVLQSDDSSLNEDEDDHDSDSDLEQELAEEFEQNFDKYHDVLDKYTHTIDDIETGRKILAERVVYETKRRVSRESQDLGRQRPVVTDPKKHVRRVSLNSKKDAQNNENNDTNDNANDAGIVMGRQRSNGLVQSIATQQRKKKLLFEFKRKKANTQLMVAAVTRRQKKSSKAFDVARSRRGSSFVDDYNLNDTLFFDGDEETENMDTDEVDIFESETDDESHPNKNIKFTIKTQPNDSDEKSGDDHASESVMDSLMRNGQATPTIIEEGDEEEEEEEDGDDEEEDEETETADPLMGTMMDIIEEEVAKESGVDDDDDDDEENVKIFDVDKDEANEKVLTFYAELNNFIEWNLDNQNINGLAIQRINGNDHGRALFVEVGVDNGWIISTINENDITHKSNDEILNEISNCDVDKGFSVRFTRLNVEVSGTDNLKPSFARKYKTGSL